MRKFLSLLVVLLTTFTSAWADGNLLPGRFSVSATKQVQFTKGNLYYSTTDSKYHLEAAQNVTYVTLGQSAYDATHVCHFFWSTNTDWQTSGKEPWASTYAYSAQATTDKFFCGEENKMNVDGTEGLYALTKDEWSYLLGDNATRNGKYAKGVSVTIGSTTVTNCLVIAPDSYSGTIATSYDASAWTTAEAAGLVCLPAAGRRSGSNLVKGGSNCHYWSATPDPDEDRENYAYSLYFYDSNVYPAYDIDRDYGFSVRLVKTPYLCFTAEAANSSVTFNWNSGSNVQASTDGTNFNAYTAGTTITLANVGDKVYFKGTGVKTDEDHHFTMTGTIAASGDVTSLTNETGGDATLTNSCYSYMFYGCTSLTTAPALPATTLANSCYLSMFQDCTSLTTAPNLPATTLAEYCYTDMFRGCTSLTAAPELPVITLAGKCYQGMFMGCTSLTTAPELPAITLTIRCYSGMFSGCTSLTAAPKLPATTLAYGCYGGMFYGCTKLNKVTVNFTDWNTSGSATTQWLDNAGTDASVTSLTFICPAGLTLPTTRSTSDVPTGWTVEKPVSTPADLTTAVGNVTAGETIQLTADIDLTATIKIESAKNFTLDLNGHVLKSTMDAPTTDGTFANLLYINHADAAITIIDTDPTATHSQEGLTEIYGGIMTGGKGHQSGTNVFGGAIHLDMGTLNIGTDDYQGGTITGNGTDDTRFGGGVANSSGTLKIKNCTISNNSVSASVGDGGGVYAVGYTEMTKCTIKGNKAANGGGIYSNNDTQTNTITECTISNNTAIAGAGIENAQQAKLDVKKCTISSNTADVYAGGILNYGNLTLEDNTSVTENQIDPNATHCLPLAGVCNLFAEGNFSTMTLKGKVTIDNNTAKGSPSNLCLFYIENEGTKYGPITLADDFDSSSKIGVTSFAFDNDENIVYGPYQFTTNYTTDAENAFTSDDSKYAVYHNAEGYLELLPVVTLNSKGYGTFSSAKDVDVATDGIEVYSATVSGETITLTKQENKYIPAGIGVLLYGGEAKANTKVSFKTKSNTDAITENDFMPTTTATAPIVAKPTTGTIWALDNENSFQKYTGSAFIANRAYLRTDVPAAKAMTLVFADETTGVANVDASTSSAQACEGKYIENGRIVILKNGRKFNAAGQQVK